MIIPIGSISIGGGGVEVVTNPNVPRGIALFMEQQRRLILNDLDKTLIKGLSSKPVPPPQPKELPMQKLRVFGGPHHGRNLEVAVARAGERYVFPGILPQGEMHSAGRTVPFSQKQVEYEVVIAKTSGERYLSYIAEVNTTYRVPAFPTSKVSEKAFNLVSNLRVVSHAAGGAPLVSYESAYEEMGKSHNTLLKYISELETRLDLDRTITIRL